MDALPYTFRLWWLQFRQRRTTEFYRRLIRRGQKTGFKTGQEERTLIGEAFAEDDIFERRIRALQTSYLLSEADRLMLPRPASDDADAWVDSDPWQRLLAPQALFDLRKLVRAEKLAASEGLRSWVGAWTGLLGVIVALVALLASS